MINVRFGGNFTPKHKQSKHEVPVPLEKSLDNRSIPPEGGVKKSMQTRAHPTKTRDGRFKCQECGQIFGTRAAHDAHHLRVHEQKASMSNTGMPIQP